VLVELARDKKSGLLKGMTDNFIPVLVDGSDDFKNKIVSVRIKKVEAANTFGEFI